MNLIILIKYVVTLINKFLMVYLVDLKIDTFW